MSLYDYTIKACSAQNRLSQLFSYGTYMLTYDNRQLFVCLFLTYLIFLIDTNTVWVMHFWCISPLSEGARTLNVPVFLPPPPPECPTGCELCVRRNTCVRCGAGLYLLHSQCHHTCPVGFEPEGQLMECARQGERPSILHPTAPHDKSF